MDAATINATFFVFMEVKKCLRSVTGKLIPAANNVRYRQRVHSVCLLSLSLSLSPSSSTSLSLSFALSSCASLPVSSVACISPTRCEHSVQRYRVDYN